MTESPAGNPVPREPGRQLILVDSRCGHPRCDETSVYRMRGHCTNCGNGALLGLFTARHEVGQGVLGRAECPTCGNRTCRWDRLATPDETPGAADDGPCCTGCGPGCACGRSPQPPPNTVECS